MNETPEFSGVLRQVVQANARFYKGWVDLSLEYLRGISEIFGAAQPGNADVTQAEMHGASALVLEAEVGAVARGAFLVSNDLGRPVSCELVASAFTDSGGTTVAPEVIFDPAMFELPAGDQRAMRVAVAIDETMQTGMGYAGSVTIKGMNGFSLPVVLRRLTRAADSASVSTASSRPVAASAASGAHSQEAQPPGLENAPRRRRGARQKN